MGLFYSFRIAMRALGANKGRTALTALGVIIGVAAVIVMVGLGQGLGNAIRNELNAEGTNWIYVGPGSQRRNIQRPGRLTVEDVKAIQRLHPDTVRTVLPVYGRMVQVKFRNRSTTTSLQASVPDFQREEAITVANGTFYTARHVAGAAKAAVLGAKVVEDLTGSKFTDMTGQTVLIDRQAFLVIGTLRPKGQLMGYSFDGQVHIPYTTARRRLQNTENVSQAIIEARHKADLPRLREQIARTLRARHAIKPPYRDNDDFTIQTQEGMLREIGTVTGIISLLLGFVASISLFVGGIGIMNIMLVSVTERTREIGLRKAIGATTHIILSQFLIESVMVSVLGGLLGVGLGNVVLNGAAAVINKMTPISIAPAVGLNSMAIAFAVSATIGIAFGLYPAWRAARLDPIMALRYE